MGETGFAASAEGATAQETLRQKNLLTRATLESDATLASAEGITLSGKDTDGHRMRLLDGNRQPFDALSCIEHRMPNH